MNGDGLDTVTDWWLRASHNYHFPGDALIDGMLRNPRNAVYYELTTAACGGWLSFWVSTAVWFVVAVMVIVALGAIIGWFDRLTR